MTALRVAAAPAVSRAAVVAYHSSPLAEPGAGDSGGMTVYVREVAARLAARGVATDIYTRATGDLPRVVEIAPGARVVTIDAGPHEPLDKERLFGHVDEFTDGIRAFATAQRLRYEVIHSHYWQSGLVATSLARSWGVPLLHSNHTLARVKNHFLAPGDSPEPAARIDGETEVIEKADVLVASTDDEWEQLSCLYGARHDRLKTVHPGVDHQVFAPGDAGAARAAVGLPEGPLLLAVGRIQPLKGLDLAIRALALLSDLGSEATLVIVGGESGSRGRAEIAKLRSLVGGLGLERRVRFTGPRPHGELPAFYNAADALVTCSHSESFGLAALEAHACGTPVVATAVGGLSHIVKDGSSGWLLNSRDPRVFAERLALLLYDEDLRRAFGATARARAARFSWDATTDDLLDLYSCLVTERWPEACTC